MSRTVTIRRVAGIIAIVFGALTLATGGATLSGALDMGRVVGFVLWFNTLAGAAYVLAGIGLLTGARWARGLAIAILLATLAVLAGFAVHVLRGLPFEPRTVGAMALRSAFWAWVVLGPAREPT